MHTAAGAHTDQRLDAVLGHQLLHINADGGDAHAGAHHGDGHAVIGAGKAQHAADVVELNRVLQKVFGNVFGAQGVAGQQNAGGDASGGGVDMRTHRFSSFPFVLTGRFRLVYKFSIPNPAAFVNGFDLCF